jgi:hypothetical protein
MNQDIIYEIIRYLYLAPEENGGALLAKKVLISSKLISGLKNKKFYKPIVFSTMGSTLAYSLIADNNLITYIDDKLYNSTYKKSSKINVHLDLHVDKQEHLVKIFGTVKTISFPKEVIDVFSIGEITSLSYAFQCSEIEDKVIGKKWDTTDVFIMNDMFEGCESFNQNIGKNWNTSNVFDMSRMFARCSKLNKNVGKYWDLSKVTFMYNMFEMCINLDKNIGKYWDTSNVKYMSNIFLGCTSLGKMLVKNGTILKL